MVVTLAKCGAIDDAKQLISTLSSGTIFSWNALISACVDSGHNSEALQYFHYMQQDGIEPDKFTYVSLFKCCGNVLDLGKGRELHNQARIDGVASDKFICTTLISMYGKCGEIIEAESVFSALSDPCVVSWNALLSVYVDCCKGDQAIRLFRQMLEEGVQVDEHTCVFSLRACCVLADTENFSNAEGSAVKMIPFEIGRAIHADLRKRGFTSNLHVGTTLLTMYGKSGEIASAECVFSRLLHRNIVSYNAMLSAYVEHQKGERALALFRQLYHEGLEPHEFTYIVALQACGILALKGKESQDLMHPQAMLVALEIGKALHQELRRNGLVSNACVGTALLGMYGKCGAITDSENVFMSMSEHDIVAWNAMLTVFIEQGNAVKALQLFWQIQRECRTFNHLTIVLVLQACGAIVGDEDDSSKERCSEIGQAVHADAHRLGFTSYSIINNTLISMYGKCGNIRQAEHVCSSLTNWNIVTGNAMLSSYVYCRQGEKALLFYEHICKEGLYPDALTLIIALQACGLLADNELPISTAGGLIKYRSLQIGKSLHADALERDFVLHPFIGTAILSMYAKCGAISEAEKIFAALSERDLVSWNALLSAYIEQGQGIKALQLYRQMQREGPSSGEVSLMMALQACSLLAKCGDEDSSESKVIKMRCLDLGKALHADARKDGYASNLVVGNTLMSMYGNCGALAEAEDVFHGISDSNIVSWNVLLSMCIDKGQGESALQIFKQLQKQENALDDVTLICMLQACASTGSLKICKQLHFAVVCAGYDRMHSVIVTLMHAYGSCASMLDAHVFFDGITDSNIVSWNACVSGHAGGGNSMISLQLFSGLRDTGMDPDAVTCTSVISACTHDGLVTDGLEYFKSMMKDDHIMPDFKHYGSLIDLLGRAGDFKRLQCILKVLPKETNSAIWLCLLGACRTHGNLELGQEAFQKAVSMQPEDATAYIMMSNLCAHVAL
ncbi:hypothetical protein KP509_14G076500 [Ceratopteris richardii]|nr:hypothetical protein KP509_14G076500 [Ceratopteris richardii]